MLDWNAYRNQDQRPEQNFGAGLCLAMLDELELLRHVQQRFTEAY